ncbi:MAG: hypothetical protein M3Q81_02085 [bacterium]|nr:hypothetical protein [bacterium]
MLASNQPNTSTTPTSQAPVVNTSPAVGSVSTSTATFGPRKPRRKIFGVDARTLLTVIGLVAFFVIAMIAVIIALRQRMGGSFAPNAPESQPSADVAKPANCTVSFTVAGVEVSPSPSPSPSASPQVSPSPSPSPSPSASPSPSPSAGTFACNSTCTTDAQCQTANGDYTCSAEAGNRCRLDTNRNSATCTPVVATYSCNSACTTNEQCATANSNYLCSDGRCRLDSAPAQANCVPPTQPTPTPTVGCNQTCATNGDCTNPAHICATTSDGSNKCRLAEYVNSTTCTPPQVNVGTQASRPPLAMNPVNPVEPDQTQPVLPDELPQSGPEDWSNWLKAGIAALGVGAVLLLLL